VFIIQQNTFKMSISNWFVDEAVVTDIASFSEPLGVSQGIGPSADDVQLGLFDYDCEILKDQGSTTAAVTIGNKQYAAGDASASYDILFDTGLFDTDTSMHVEQDGSSGSVKFCVRTVSYEGDLDVGLRDTKFRLDYDLTDIGYSITGVTISANAEDTFVEGDVGTGFSVDVCQCGLDYVCAESAVEQNTPLVFCLMPIHANSDAQNSVWIPNFSATITAGDLTYQPVTTGSMTYQPNALTEIFVSMSETVMVSTLLLATFYTAEENAVDVAGLAFLEFKSSAPRNGRRAFEDYGMTIDLEVAPGIGCMETIFRAVGDLF
jgi:hypothetical protein